MSTNRTDVGTAVDIIRLMLDQAGRTQHVNEELEPNIVSMDNKVYLAFPDIVSIIGCWLETDTTFSNNLASGGSFDSKEGVLTLGQSVASGTPVLVTYVRRNGITDDTIEQIYEMSKTTLKLKMMYDFDFDDTTSQINVMAKHTAIILSTYWCLLTLNSGNALQSGYNYRVMDFEVQTKLFGEGMSTEGLLEKFKERSDYMIDSLGYHIGKFAQGVPRGYTKTSYKNKSPSSFSSVLKETYGNNWGRVLTYEEQRLLFGVSADQC